MSDSFIEVVAEPELMERIGQLGAIISEHYQGRNPVMVGVLKGAAVFLADLIREMNIDVQIDFLALTRFGSEGRVGIAMDTSVALQGRHVILVEDIVDTGLTLTTLRRLLETRGLASLATCALIDKSTRRIVDVPLEYRGFEVGDEFLLGYGLDWNGRYRNIRSLWAAMDLGELTEDPGALASLVFGQSSRNGAPLR